MRTRGLGTVFLAAAAVAAAAAGLPFLSQSAGGDSTRTPHQLQGIVCAQGGNPIKRAEVWLVAADQSGETTIDEHTTDKNGAYYFDGDPIGSYRLEVDYWTVNAADARVSLGQQTLTLHDITVVNVPPLSPNSSIPADAGETIVVRFNVGKDGRARDFKVVSSSGDDDLDQAAIEALMKARWRPGMYKGFPTVSRFTHTFVVTR